MGKKPKTAGANDTGTSTDTNALVVTKKTKNSKKKEKSVQAKLSKRKRKKLELVLARRAKKANRSSVLNKLQDLPQVELENLHSVTALGKRPEKRKNWTTRNETKNLDSESESSGSELSSPDMTIDTSATAEMIMSEQCLTMSSDAKEQSFVDKLRNDISEKREDDDPELSLSLTGPEIVTGLKRVRVERSEELTEKRNELPIISEEHNVLEAVATNTVCIVCGATGSGKTTQVPQFLYEAGYCENGMIGVTQPRRVAAISTSQRVAEELDLPSSVISYSVRFESNCTPDTKIKFMTDGVLLREAQQDFLLKNYSVLILDEAHERSEFTDILIGLVSRIAPLRKRRNMKPLKIVIMSATMRTQDFTDNKLLFKNPPPVVEVESRQYPVTALFQKRTPAENQYLKEAYKKICKVHRTLPGGGILVFVTGKDEINLLTEWLESTFPRTAVTAPEEKDLKTTNKGTDSPETTRVKASKRLKLENYGEEADKDRGGTKSEDNDEGDVLLRMSMYKDINQATADKQCPLFVLPLHSLLSSEEQKLVFKPPPVGSRLCVVATNVAETSLTIPNIAYVIDTGKVKRKVYDTVTGVSTFVVDWIAKSSAEQRAGRAGRTRAGYCYRLYSSAVYSEFANYPKPEILCRPVDDLVLMMKSLGLTRVAKFPFPNAPSSEAIMSAEKHLYHLGALKKSIMVSGETSYSITDLGVTMTKFGITPRFAKMLALSNQPRVGSGKVTNMLAYTIALVSALTVREIFKLPTDSKVNEGERGTDSENKKAQNRYVRETLRKWQGPSQVHALGDMIVLLNAVIEFEKVRGSALWCDKHGLRLKAMIEIRKLRIDITNIVNSVLRKGEALSTRSLDLDPVDTKEEADILRQIILSGLGDRVARRVHTDDHFIREQNLKHMEKTNEKTENKLKIGKNAYQAVNVEGFVYIYPHSVLAMELPEWIAFQEIQESSKVYAKDCIAVEESWLPHLFPSYCNFSDPLDDSPPFYDSDSDSIKCNMTCTYANNVWPIKSQEYNHPVNLKYYKLFAMFLLEGKVFRFFEQFLQNYVSPPSVINKPWSKLQERTESLVNALVNRHCCSKARLKEEWNKEPSYLMKEFLQWVPTDCCFSVQAKWPPEQ